MSTVRTSLEIQTVEYGVDPDSRTTPVRHHPQYLRLLPDERRQVDEVLAGRVARLLTAHREGGRLGVLEWSSTNRPPLYRVKEVPVMECDHKEPAPAAPAWEAPREAVRARFRFAVVAALVLGWVVNVLLAGVLGVLFADPANALVQKHLGREHAATSPAADPPEASPVLSAEPRYPADVGSPSSAPGDRVNEKQERPCERPRAEPRKPTGCLQDSFS